MWGNSTPSIQFQSLEVIVKVFSTILLLLTLTGCSALEAVSGIAGAVSGDAPALSVEAQVGDKVANVGKTDNSVINAEDNEGTLTVTSNKSDKQFSEVKEVNIQESNSSMEMWLYIIGLLGWLLPSPTVIYKEVKSWVKK